MAPRGAWFPSRLATPVFPSRVCEGSSVERWGKHVGINALAPRSATTLLRGYSIVSPTRVYNLLVSSIYPLFFYSSDSIPHSCINTRRSHSDITTVSTPQVSGTLESLLRIQQSNLVRGCLRPSSGLGSIPVADSHEGHRRPCDDVHISAPVISSMTIPRSLYVLSHALSLSEDVPRRPTWTLWRCRLKSRMTRRSGNCSASVTLTSGCSKIANTE